MRQATAILGLLGILVAGVAILRTRRAHDRPDRILLDHSNQSVRFAATFHPTGFTAGGGMPGFHLIAWRRGRAASSALLQTDVTDRDVLDALKRLGLSPGENLAAECWTAVDDPHHPVPDRRADGPAVRVLVEWNVSLAQPTPAGATEGTGTPETRSQVGIEDILAATSPGDLDFRFVGGEAFIEKWRAGAICTLYSCPSAKIANASFSVRDYRKAPARFATLAENLPPDGMTATVILQVVR